MGCNGWLGKLQCRDSSFFHYFCSFLLLLPFPLPRVNIYKAILLEIPTFVLITTSEPLYKPSSWSYFLYSFVIRVDFIWAYNIARHKERFIIKDKIKFINCTLFDVMGYRLQRELWGLLAVWSNLEKECERLKQLEILETTAVWLWQPFSFTKLKLEQMECFRFLYSNNDNNNNIVSTLSGVFPIWTGI